MCIYVTANSLEPMWSCDKKKGNASSLGCTKTTCDANPPRIYTTLVSSYDKAFTKCQVNAARSRLHGSFSCTCFVLSGTGYFSFLMLNSCWCNCEESWRIQEETGFVLILSLLSCMSILNPFPNIISSLDRFEGLRLDISDCDLCCL